MSSVDLQFQLEIQFRPFSSILEELWFQQPTWTQERVSVCMLPFGFNSGLWMPYSGPKQKELKKHFGWSLYGRAISVPF